LLRTFPPIGVRSFSTFNGASVPVGDAFAFATFHLVYVSRNFHGSSVIWGEV
jgi:hypothetical protein